MYVFIYIHTYVPYVCIGYVRVYVYKNIYAFAYVDGIYL